MWCMEMYYLIRCSQVCLICVAVLPLLGSDAASQMIEVAKLQAGDRQPNGGFGVSVSMSLDRALIGAVGTDGFGAAYVFEREEGGTWTQVTRLMASDGEAGDDFAMVSLSGDRAIVGALNEDSGGSSAGAAYIFERDGTGTWSEVTKLLASDSRAGEQFGASVSISGDRAIVGVTSEGSGGTDTGSAYVFERRAGGTWSEVETLRASDMHSGDGFGASVSIRGERAIVGAVGMDGSGAAYVFERHGSGVWAEVAKLHASDGEANDAFGTSVSLGADRAIVGAPFEDTGGANAGAAYIFERDGGGTWTETVRLLASDRETMDWFGLAVSILDHRAMVTALFEDEGGAEAGAAYLFERDGQGPWLEVAKLMPRDPEAGDWFGASIALGPDHAMVGAPLEDTGGVDAGAAYMFEPLGVGVDIARDQFPSEISLAQNYPNPFNPLTTISFALPEAVDVSLSVFDVLSRKIRVLVSGSQPAGTHTVSFDASGLSSGIYVYRLDVGDLSETKRMVVLR